MFHTEFPNIVWLKEQIRRGFSGRKTWDNRDLTEDGWPSVILNVQTSCAVREDIKGPFSLFLNQKGWSRVQADGRSTRINPDAYLLTNFGEHYDLIIDGEEEQTETLNFHFGERFYFEALHVLRHSEAELLDKPHSDSSALHIPVRTLIRDEGFDHHVQRALTAAKTTDDVESEELFGLFTYVMQQNLPELARLRAMPLLRAATREEMQKRLFVARDYIHAHYKEALCLDDLAEKACLSKFHFLRSFKAAFRCSPYQYVKHLRLQKALSLIKNSRLSVEEIAFCIGLENGSSLSRMIHQATGQYPSAFR